MKEIKIWCTDVDAVLSEWTGESSFRRKVKSNGNQTISLGRLAKPTAKTFESSSKERKNLSLFKLQNLTVKNIKSSNIKYFIKIVKHIFHFKIVSKISPAMQLILKHIRSSFSKSILWIKWSVKQFKNIGTLEYLSVLSQWFEI